MDRMIKIEKLSELKFDYIKNSKEFYSVYDVLDFYIEDNQLIYPLDNSGDTGKMKCLKRYDNKYKIFGYKTLGVLSHTKYFLLDMENNKLYLYRYGSEWAELKDLKTWVEYLMSGGSEEKAIAENNKYKSDFDPTQGI